MISVQPSVKVMDSSSSDSFAWTNASTASRDSLDSDRMAINNTSKGLCDEESESGKSYKKKLKKQLFQNSNQCDDNANIQSNEKIKRKKIKQEKAHDMDSRREHIKVEPESDIEMSKKKKKSSYKETNNICDDSQESNDESFLNFKVKEEQLKYNGNPNSQHLNVCPDNIETELSDSVIINNLCKSKKKKRIKNNEQDGLDVMNDSSMNNSSHELDQDWNKKQKKKKCKDRSNSTGNEDLAIEDKFCAEDTVVGIVEVGTEHDTNDSNSLSDTIQLVKNKKKGKQSLNKGDPNHIATKLKQQILEHNNLKTKGGTKNKISCENNNNNNSMSTEVSDQLHISGYVNNNTSDLPNTKSLRIPRISDRITFEDDNDSEMETSQIYAGQSTKLKKFLLNNDKLSQVSPQLINEILFTDDDEIWILKCPSEVKIEALHSANLKLDSKCKIKVEGQTYVGSVEENTSLIPILTMENSKFITKTIPLNGVINLRKRIPKTHFPEANIIVNNQTNFIPLPETKCRHPLFGLNYKKSIKISSAVAKRLKFCEESIDQVEKTRKKNKKHKNKETSVDADYESIVVPKSEPQAETVIKNKRKRKHADDYTAPAKKSKQSKHNLNIANGWESEKAIEKNLFDF